MKKIINLLVVLTLLIGCQKKVVSEYDRLNSRYFDKVENFHNTKDKSVIYATGSHIEYKGKFFIITNKHVCDIYKRDKLSDAYVNGRMQKIIRIDDNADLCIVKSYKKKGFKVASKVHNYERITLVGHPRGLPLIIRKGRINTELLILPVMGMGYMPANQITATAYPGNSGSPVLNEHDELVGVLFAGRPGYPNEPYIVPLKNVLELLEEVIKL